MPHTAALRAEIRGEGPAVVLLHGQPGRADNWDRTVELLEDRYRTIAPDRPGYGRTEGAAGDFATNADATLALLDKLEIDRAVVVGHSWAGGVAIEMASIAPDRVAGLVLVASVAPGEPVGLTDRVLAKRPIGDIAAMVTIGVIGRALGLTPLRRLAAKRSSPEAVDYLARTVTAGGWRSFVTEQRAYVAQIEHLGSKLSSVRAPTRVVVGSADRVVSPEANRLLAQAIAGAKLELIEGAGHLLPWDQPAEVVTAIDEVVAESGLRAGGVTPSSDSQEAADC